MCVIRQYAHSTDEFDSRLVEKNLSWMPRYHEDTNQVLSVVPVGMAKTPQISFANMPPSRDVCVIRVQVFLEAVIYSYRFGWLGFFREDLQYIKSTQFRNSFKKLLRLEILVKCTILWKTLWGNKITSFLNKCWVTKLKCTVYEQSPETEARKSIWNS